jgi:hypothetical protein
MVQQAAHRNKELVEGQSEASTGLGGYVGRRLRLV